MLAFGGLIKSEMLQSLTADLNTCLSSLDQLLAKNGQEFNLSPLIF